MDRFAVFVDAGYLYAGASKICCADAKNCAGRSGAPSGNRLRHGANNLTRADRA